MKGPQDHGAPWSSWNTLEIYSVWRVHAALCRNRGTRRFLIAVSLGFSMALVLYLVCMAVGYLTWLGVYALRRVMQGRRMERWSCNFPCKDYCILRGRRSAGVLNSIPEIKTQPQINGGRREETDGPL